MVPPKSQMSVSNYVSICTGVNMVRSAPKYVRAIKVRTLALVFLVSFPVFQPAVTSNDFYMRKATILLKGRTPDRTPCRAPSRCRWLFFFELLAHGPCDILLSNPEAISGNFRVTAVLWWETIRIKRSFIRKHFASLLCLIAQITQKPSKHYAHLRQLAHCSR